MVAAARALHGGLITSCERVPTHLRSGFHDYMTIDLVRRSPTASFACCFAWLHCLSDSTCSSTTSLVFQHLSLSGTAKCSLTSLQFSLLLYFSGNYALCPAMLLSQSLLFSCLTNECSLPPYFYMNSLEWLFLVSEWLEGFGVVLVWVGLMGHQHGTYSGHILPTNAWIAFIFFALENPYSHLPLDSLNLPALIRIKQNSSSCVTVPSLQQPFSLSYHHNPLVSDLLQKSYLSNTPIRINNGQSPGLQYAFYSRTAVFGYFLSISTTTARHNTRIMMLERHFSQLSNAYLIIQNEPKITMLCSNAVLATSGSPLYSAVLYPPWVIPYGIHGMEGGG